MIKVNTTVTKPRKSGADVAFVVCNTLFMIAFVVITLYPVLNTVAVSFNDGTDAVRGHIGLWPRIFLLRVIIQFFKNLQ